MIIRLSVENWMSFCEQTSFSMIASRERQHKERIPRIDRFKTGILPVAVIYGGNASGKTNLFKALSFAKRFVVKGTQPDSTIPIEPFRLGSHGVDSPVRFSFELLIEEMIYEFTFAVNKKAVLEEKLVRISKSNEHVLYHRKNKIIMGLRSATLNSNIGSSFILRMGVEFPLRTNVLTVWGGTCLITIKGIDHRKMTQAMIIEAIHRARQRDNPCCADWPRTTGTTMYRLVERINNRQ